MPRIFSLWSDLPTNWPACFFPISTTLCFKEQPSLQPEPATVIKNPAGLFHFPLSPESPCLTWEVWEWVCHYDSPTPWRAPEATMDSARRNRDQTWGYRILAHLRWEELWRYSHPTPLIFFLFQRRKVPPSTENVTHTQECQAWGTNTPTSRPLDHFDQSTLLFSTGVCPSPGPSSSSWDLTP